MPSHQSQPPAAGEAAHTPINPGSMLDTNLPPFIPPGFSQLNANGGGGARREAGDIEWSPYKKQWFAAYRAGTGYAIGNTSVVARPTPEVLESLRAIACNSHAGLVAALEEARSIFGNEATANKRVNAWREQARATLESAKQ